MRYLTVIINVNSVYLVVVPQHFYFGSKSMYSTILCYMMQCSRIENDNTRRFNVIEYEVIKPPQYNLVYNLMQSSKASSLLLEMPEQRMAALLKPLKALKPLNVKRLLWRQHTRLETMSWLILFRTNTNLSHVLLLWTCTMFAQTQPGRILVSQ